MGILFMVRRICNRKGGKDQIYHSGPRCDLENVPETLVKNWNNSDSSIKLSDLHTTQTPASEARWAARFSGHWVVTSMFA